MLTFRPRVAASIGAILCVVSVRVDAQKDAFRDALIGFHASLSGDYGDEGPLAAGNLERMASALAAWDQAIGGAERNLRARLASASAGERVQVHTTLAQLYVERGRHADAIRELDAAIQVDGNNAGLLVARGLVLEIMGRQADAVAAFGRAWNADRENPAAAYLFSSRRAAPAESDEVTPQAAQLLKALERRLASVPPDRHISLLAEMALVPDSAAVTPVFALARYVDGFALVERTRYQEAIASFRRAMAGDPLVVDAAVRLQRLQPAIARLRDGESTSVIPLLEAAAAAAPRSSEVHRILAAAYADAGNDAGSIGQLETAAGLAPEDERVVVALGRSLVHAGHTEQAERVLRGAVERLPQSADAHSALADLYERSERAKRAIGELEAAAAFTVPAGKASLYFRLADLQHRHLEYERVIDPLVRRVRLRPNDARAHTDLGLAYTRVGRTNAALVELVTASLVGPDDPEALTAIGQIHFDAGRYAAAETVLQRAIAVGPALAQARYLLGHSLSRLGRADDGRVQFAEFDRLRAAANDEARRSFELNMLRQDAVRATEARRLEEAVAVWQKVVGREPKSFADRKALAGALVRVGRPALAAEQLEAAARLEDVDKEVYRQLAELYARLGRDRESAAALQTYQRLAQEQRRGR